MHKKIPSVVWYLSIVSFLNDTASEMLYPVMPIFLTSVLGAPIFVVGIIEGVAESIASLFKTIFGYYSDKLQKRKPFIVAGYGASAVAKAMIALSYIWPMVLVGRIIDRLGKGARTGARDALLLEASNDTNKGFIFGFHRSMDTAGAVVGPTIALLLLYLFHNNIRLILYIAIIPALLSLTFFIFVKEGRKKIETTKLNLSLSLKSLPKQLQIFLLGLSIFSLGNSSDAFLILKAKNLGLSLTLIIVAYILYNIVYALSSTPAGSISDKIGPKKVFIAGTLVFSLVYLGFALNTTPFFVYVLFALYGFYIALTDGISKALIGSMIQTDNAGTIYGVFNTVTSIFTLLASVIGGYLWSIFSPSAPFYFAVVCSLLSLVVFSFLKTHSDTRHR